jgi:YkoY family integral membrane protein
MLGQAFSVSDAPTILTLAFLEGLLSADNALVLAILVRALPKHQQKKGLLYGLVGAFVLRGIMILIASELIRYWWVQALGAAYLLYLAVRHFILKASHKASGKHTERKHAGFWSTIVVVELTDLAFAIDSILAAVALVGPPPVVDGNVPHIHPKLWVIYTGGLLGVVAMRFVANTFLKLLERFPRLETSAYLIIAWISVKLGLESYGHYVITVRHEHASLEHLPAWLFWTVMLVLFGGGFLPGKKGASPHEPDGIS